MEKPFMYIEQPEIEIKNRPMQNVYYSNEEKEKEHLHIPTYLGNVVCDITLEDETVRGEILQEKESELIIQLEDGEERTIAKNIIKNLQVVRL